MKSFKKLALYRETLRDLDQEDEDQIVQATTNRTEVATIHCSVCTHC
ncbi:MAG TPA: hypothetical protein VFE33_13470 [Thermoanaerobaculia bacterium]|nr:hypothetical protein [Thermoanaerobaculia bacterium]